MAKPSYFMVHSAVTLMPKEYVLGVLPNGKPQVHRDGEEEEICQFAAEFHKFPMPETHFRDAFNEMRERCIEKARAAGLILS